MDSDAFTISRREAVGLVTLSRPQAGNRLLTDEVRALGRAIRALGEEATIKAVVVRAEGEAFCLGRKPASAGEAPRTALGVRAGVTQPILDLYADVRATPVPVIALVQGEARGFGCALVGQCDLAIASEAAVFSMPEMETNLPPTLAISAVLGKVPPKRLLHLVYTRRQIRAAEALEIGLLSEVVPASELETALQATLATLTDRSRAAVCAVKEYMAVAPHVDPYAASRLASNILSVVLSSPGDA
ncbi:MAG: enoyl-CoA hydratase/isomerase family protein [Rhodoblastus sp.]